MGQSDKKTISLKPKCWEQKSVWGQMETYEDKGGRVREKKLSLLPLAVDYS